MKRIRIKVIPRASRNEIVGELANGELKIKLTSPPLDGAANAAMLTFLSDVWQIPKSKMTIVQGEKSRHKVIEIID